MLILCNFIDFFPLQFIFYHMQFLSLVCSLELFIPGSVVLNPRVLCPLDVWQCLEIFLVIRGDKVLLASGRERPGLHWTARHNRGQPKMSILPTLKNPVLGVSLNKSLNQDSVSSYSCCCFP